MIFVDMSCRGKLAKLDEKLTLMEQKVEYIEARVRYNYFKFMFKYEWNVRVLSTIHSVVLYD